MKTQINSVGQSVVFIKCQKELNCVSLSMVKATLVTGADITLQFSSSKMREKKQFSISKQRKVNM